MLLKMSFDWNSPDKKLYFGKFCDSVPQRQHISFQIWVSDGSCAFRKEDGGCLPLELNWSKMSNVIDHTPRYFKWEKCIEWPKFPGASSLNLLLGRAYSSCFIHAIVARMRLPFFKIFSNFVHFCLNFQIFYPFCPFFALFLKNCMHALSF